MTDPLQQKSHAQVLLNVTREYTGQMIAEQRIDVCIATLDYLLNNFADDHEYCDEDDCGYDGTYVNVDDIQDLIAQLKGLK